MDRKSEILLNLINAVIYQVESGEAYAITDGILPEDVEYTGFTLVVGLESDDAYHCHAYGYEDAGKSHILNFNPADLDHQIHEFIESTMDAGSLHWKTAIIEIPEDTGESAADFIYGRDSESWLTPDIRLAEFVRPGNSVEKDLEWHKNIYRIIHGCDRVEGLPKKKYAGAIETVVELPPEMMEELDDNLSSEIEKLFSHDENFEFPDYNLTMQNLQAPEIVPSVKPELASNRLKRRRHKDMAGDTLIAPVPPQNADEATLMTVAPPRNTSLNKFKCGIGKFISDKKVHPVETPASIPEIVETTPPAVPSKIAPTPKVIPKNEILPSLIRYASEELKEKEVECSMASIIIYLQPPVIASYGFWYGEETQGYWLPESFDLDDAMDAFMRDTIPDPKNPWDVCILRMNFDTRKITAEFLKGRPGYLWMEPMAHRSKKLSEIAKYREL